MDLQKLSEVFNKPSLRLLRNPYAEMILSILFEEFRNKERNSIKEDEFIHCLSDKLSEKDFSELEENQKKLFYENDQKAKLLLKKWLEYGFIKNFPDERGIATYELTSHTTKVLDWVSSLYNKREFVGTESRLKDIFSKLKELIEFSDDNVQKRINDLEAKKKEIEDEILKIKITNKVDLFDDYQITSRLNDLTKSAKELLSDFKEVEDNFKGITRNIYLKHTDPNQTKAKILAYTFDSLEELRESDQGKSFYAFWDFLIAKSRQDEWKEMILQLFSLLDKRGISYEDVFLKKMKLFLHQNGQKVYEANDRMAEKLSRVIAEKELSERLKAKQTINALKELALRLADKGIYPDCGIVIETYPEISLQMERKVNLKKEEAPEINIQLSTDPLKIEDMEALNKVFSRFTIDKKELISNIKNVLESNTQVSLKQITEVYPIRKGLPELFAYFSLAKQTHFKSVFNEEHTEDILFDTQNLKLIKIPQIIYRK